MLTQIAQPTTPKNLSYSDFNALLSSRLVDLFGVYFLEFSFIYFVDRLPCFITADDLPTLREKMQAAGFSIQ